MGTLAAVAASAISASRDLPGSATTFNVRAFGVTAGGLGFVMEIPWRL
jgi:hypothetical protein